MVVIWAEIFGGNVVLVANKNGQERKKKLEELLNEIKEAETGEILKKIYELLSLFSSQPLSASPAPLIAKFYPCLSCISIGRTLTQVEWIPELTLPCADIVSMSAEGLIAEIFGYFLPGGSEK